jgi:phosphate/sulfate permease
VHWAAVRDIAIGWVVTLPVTALLGAFVLLLWRAAG